MNWNYITIYKKDEQNYVWMNGVGINWSLIATKDKMDGLNLSITEFTQPTMLQNLKKETPYYSISKGGSTNVCL